LKRSSASGISWNPLNLERAAFKDGGLIEVKFYNGMTKNVRRILKTGGCVK
jgi:hypothetical protein